MLYRTLSVTVVVLSFFVTTPTHASSIIFETQTEDAMLGTPYSIDVYVDTEGESINAIEAKFELEGPVLVEEIYDGDSVVSLWIEQPNLVGSHISLAGIIPGGFDGVAIPGSDVRQPGKLFTVVLRPQSEGNVTLDTAAAEILLADGEGTATTVSTSTVSFIVLPTTADIAETQDSPLEDVQGPTLISSSVEYDVEGLPSGPVLFFDIRDDSSGVAYTELAEDDGVFVRVNSPYVIADTTTRLELKMVDKVGNVTTEIIHIEAETQSVDWWYPIAILIIVLVVLLYSRSKKRKD